MTALYITLTTLCLFGLVAFGLIRSGRSEAEKDQANKTLNTVQKVNDAQNNVANDPVERQRLLDKYTRR